MKRLDIFYIGDSEERNFVFGLGAELGSHVMIVAGRKLETAIEDMKAATGPDGEKVTGEYGISYLYAVQRDYDRLGRWQTSEIYDWTPPVDWKPIYTYSLDESYLSEGGPGSGRKPGSAMGNDKGRKIGARNLKNREGGDDGEQKNIPGIPAQPKPEVKVWSSPSHHELLILNGTINNLKKIGNGNVAGAEKGVCSSFKAEITAPDGTKASICYKKEESRGERFNEKGVFLLDKAMELGLTPPTDVRDNGPNGEGYSAMLWRDDAVVAADGDLGKVPLFEWEKMSVLDLLINQADRHNWNYMVNNTNHTLVAIDHGRTLGFRGFRGDNAFNINPWGDSFVKVSGKPIDPRIHEHVKKLISREADIKKMFNFGHGDGRETAVALTNLFKRANAFLKLKNWPHTGGYETALKIADAGD